MCEFQARFTTVSMPATTSSQLDDLVSGFGNGKSTVSSAARGSKRTFQKVSFATSAPERQRSVRQCVIERSTDQRVWHLKVYNLFCSASLSEKQPLMTSRKMVHDLGTKNVDNLFGSAMLNTYQNCRMSSTTRAQERRQSVRQEVVECPCSLRGSSS